MSVNMAKGGNVSLVKNGIPLRRISVRCGWDANERGGQTYDLDLTAAALDDNGKVPDLQDPTDPGYQEWFIHANHRRPSGKAIRFKGDNRTGRGEGDDEEIDVDLDHIPALIERIAFAVVIWDALNKGGQTFGHVKNAYIRIVDLDSGEEIARFNLSDTFTEETLVAFGELYRRGSEWKFRAVSGGYAHARTYRELLGIPRPFETEFARPGYR